MFSPLVIAEFPTYDEAFGRRKPMQSKRNWPDEEAHKRAATRTCAVTVDPTRRIVLRTSRSRKIGSASMALLKQPCAIPVIGLTIYRTLESPLLSGAICLLRHAEAHGCKYFFWSVLFGHQVQGALQFLGSFSMVSTIGMRLLWKDAQMRWLRSFLVGGGLRFSDDRRIALHHE